MLTDRTPEDYEAEINRLRDELEKAKNKSAVPITGTLAIGGKTTAHTIFGIEEMLLQVNEDSTVGYVNSQMAKLLGIPNRKVALGTELSLWDNGPIGSGVLAALVQVARSSDEPHVLERNCPDVKPDLLPASKAKDQKAILSFVSPLRGLGGACTSPPKT